MIECFKCKNWFHDECIGLNECDIKQVLVYFCTDCIEYYNTHEHYSLKIIYKNYIKEHTKPLFNSHKILTVHNLYTHHTLLELYKGKGTFGHYMPGETKYTPRIEDLDPSACIGYSNIIVHCGINDIKYNGCNVEECAKRLINKVEAIKSLCPKSKITLNPLLPSKSDFLNARATQFNRILFHYIDTRHDNLLQTVNFNVFQDEKSWLLKEDLGRFNNSRDLIHLGSSGIRLLVTIVKERVCGSRVDGRSYAGVTSGNRGMKRVGSVRVNRVSMNMMIDPPTASDTLPAPSQQVQS